MSFLRLFSGFRSLEDSLVNAHHESQYLREQLAEERIINAELRNDLREATAGRIKATETVADFVSQLRYGRKIYDHVPELPEKPIEVEPTRKTRPRASDLVVQAERDFFEALKKQSAASQQPLSQAAVGSYLSGQ